MGPLWAEGKEKCYQVLLFVKNTMTPILFYQLINIFLNKFQFKLTVCHLIDFSSGWPGTRTAKFSRSEARLLV